MKPHTKFVILIHFNDLNWNKNIPRLTKDWIEHRMTIFMNYTFKSLKGQTNQDFETIILYDILSEELIFEALNAYNSLPHNMHFMPKKEGLKYIKKSLDSYDYLCFTKLDSDNMYHTSYMEFLHNYNPKETSEFLAFSKGYAFNALTGELATYTATREYFYVRLLKVEDYLKGNLPPIPIGQTESAKQIAYELIEDVPIFTIVCHGTNVNNTYRLVRPSCMIKDTSQISQIWKSFTNEEAPFLLTE